MTSPTPLLDNLFKEYHRSPEMEKLQAKIKKQLRYQERKELRQRLRHNTNLTQTGNNIKEGKK